MSRMLKWFLRVIANLWAKIFTYDLGLRFQSYGNSLYTIWIRNFIGELPENSTIAYPCRLQGEGRKNILIGHHTFVGSHVILGCWMHYGEQEFSPSIIIGNNCYIGEYSHITSCNKITIGDGLLTGRYVYIGDNSHGGLSIEEALIPPISRKLISKGEIVIGNNVWLGDKVAILAGAHIGDNVIVAANAVVTKDVPSNSLVAGVPAMIVKEL